VLLRTRKASERGDSLSGSAVVAAALRGGMPVASTEIVPQAELLREGEELARRSRTMLVPTPRARPTTKVKETSGMVLAAAAPVFAGDRLVGVLYGGKLLNGRHELVDRIKATVYEGQTCRGREVGTATIFQGDLRVSTNVRTPDGQRAIGTRVSAEVYDSVVVRGQPWLERAFVVDDWYLTAYEPIRDLSGGVVGILYVGVYEGKFAAMERNALLAFAGISAGGVILSVLICFVLSRRLAGPVHALVEAARGLAGGDLHQRVRPATSIEEIGVLGSAFNAMAASIEERDRRLQRQAEEQILKSEKLAMIGRLAAGVAHEINNPLGSILLFSRLLLRKAPPAGLVRENLERIAKEADRCKNIVQGLLDFARQRELKVENVDLNEVIRKPVALLEGQASFHNIEIVEHLQDDLPPVSADASQVQQVFVNILVNAAEAMEGSGTLTITSHAIPDQQRVEVRFTDTGRGITPEDISRLFEPFFTTKEVGEGTGLGLSISYGIIRRHGGTIEVRSRVGGGSTFVVSLPTAPTPLPVESTKP